jgi:hypothetical protein
MKVLYDPFSTKGIALMRVFDAIGVPKALLGYLSDWNGEGPAKSHGWHDQMSSAVVLYEDGSARVYFRAYSANRQRLLPKGNRHAEVYHRAYDTGQQT